MREGNQQLVRREDYTAPAFWIRSAFELCTTPVRSL